MMMDTLINLLAAIGFYLVPILLGWLVLGRWPRQVQLVNLWVVGTVMLVFIYWLFHAFATVLGLEFATVKIYLQTFVSSLALMGLFFRRHQIIRSLRGAGAHRKSRRFPVAGVTTKTNSIWSWLVVAAILTAIGLLIWRYASPYPSPLNWDIYEHLTLTNLLNQGEFYWQLSAYSDTFLVNSYLPIYHVLLAVPQLLLPVEPLGYYYFLEIIHYTLTIFFSGWLAWQLTQNRSITVLTMVLGTFVFESFVAYTPLFHLPQTLAALFFTICLAELVGRIREGLPVSWGMVLMWCLFLVGSHFFVGTFGAFILAGVYLWYAGSQREIFSWFKSVDFLNWLIVAAVVFMILVVVLGKFLRLDPFQTAESEFFNLSLGKKIETFTHWYGWGLFILLPVAVLRVLSKPGVLSKLMVAIVLGGLSAVLVAFPYNFKLYTVLRYPVHVLMAYGLVELLGLIQVRWLKVIGVAVWVTVFGGLFYINQQQVFKQWIEYDGTYTHVSATESEAAQFLKQQYPDGQSVLLISDPATQYILEALGGVNTQGGAYMIDRTREIVDFIYPSRDLSQVREILSYIRDQRSHSSPSKLLLAISGRFFEWQDLTREDKLKNYINIWRPADLSLHDQIFVRELKDSPYFTPVFENQAMAIFELQ